MCGFSVVLGWAQGLVCLLLGGCFFVLRGIFISVVEERKEQAAKGTRIKEMSFLQPTAPEDWWCSAWKQGGATPRKSCYCAQLHLSKDLLALF